MQEMSGAKKQYANIIRIDDLIRRGTCPSVQRLAEVTGLSQRQVLRILKDMREVYHAPLHYDRQQKGYCYLLDGYSVADISLDEDESLALRVCSDFIAKVFGGTRLFARLHRGISSLQRRAELYDMEEGRALADRIQLATSFNSMQFALFRRQEDFEDILFSSLKEGHLLRVSLVDREEQIHQETCLPLMLIMHEDFAWLLFYIKASAFSADFTTLDLQKDSFGILHLSGVTAVSPYKDGHARPVTIANRLTLWANSAVGNLEDPTAGGIQKVLSLGFGLAFPALNGCGPYRVVLDYALDEETLEYRLCEDDLLGGVFLEGEDLFASPGDGELPEDGEGFSMLLI